MGAHRPSNHAKALSLVAGLLALALNGGERCLNEPSAHQRTIRSAWVPLEIGDLNGACLKTCQLNGNVFENTN